MRRLVIVVGVAVALSVGLAGCGSSTSAKRGSGAGTGVTKATVTATTEPPLPPGPRPAKVATMVCDDEAQAKIARVLGIGARVPTPTWDVKTHVYSCRFGYPTGSFTLSVKEELGWAATKAYFNALGRQLGETDTLGNLGQGAFLTKDGSVVVRKDWKILVVDISGLHRSIGNPPTTPAAVAYSVADIILGCWDGD